MCDNERTFRLLCGTSRRSNSASLVWGNGIRVCVGAPLARLEIRVALEEQLARTTRIALVGGAPVTKGLPGNGFAALHLTAWPQDSHAPQVSRSDVAWPGTDECRDRLTIKDPLDLVDNFGTLRTDLSRNARESAGH